MAWHQPQKYCNFNPTLMYRVMDDKCNLRCPKLKIPNRICNKVSFLNILSKIPHNFHGIQHCIMNLREFCVPSNLKHKHLSGQWPLRCIWSIACWRCSNYIFILEFTPGFIGLGRGICQIICYWYHAKFATGRRIAIWGLKQNCWKVCLKERYLVSWYPNKICFFRINHVYWNYEKHGPIF